MRCKGEDGVKTEKGNWEQGINDDIGSVCYSLKPPAAVLNGIFVLFWHTI